MLHVGLDLSRRRVDVCLISSEGDLVEHFRAPSDRDGLYGLSRRVAVYDGGRPSRGLASSDAASADLLLCRGAAAAAPPKGPLHHASSDHAGAVAAFARLRKPACGHTRPQPPLLQSGNARAGVITTAAPRSCPDHGRRPGTRTLAERLAIDGRPTGAVPADEGVAIGKSRSAQIGAPMLVLATEAQSAPGASGAAAGAFRVGCDGLPAALDPDFGSDLNSERQAHRPAIAACASASFARTVSVPSLNSSKGRTSHVTSPNSG